jgi:hypothetical protein
MARHVPRKKQKPLSDTELLKTAFQDYKDTLEEVTTLHHKRTAVLDYEEIIALDKGREISEKSPRAIRKEDLKVFLKALDLLIVRSVALTQDKEYVSFLRISGIENEKKHFAHQVLTLCALRHGLGGTPLSGTVQNMAHAWEGYLKTDDFFRDFFHECDLSSSISMLDKKYERRM